MMPSPFFLSSFFFFPDVHSGGLSVPVNLFSISCMKQAGVDFISHFCLDRRLSGRPPFWQFVHLPQAGSLLLEFFYPLFFDADGKKSSFQRPNG